MFLFKTKQNIINIELEVYEKDEKSFQNILNLN